MVCYANYISLNKTSNDIGWPCYEYMLALEVLITNKLYFNPPLEDLKEQKYCKKASERKT